MFFFFKQKTAYEISLGLVGSEMCIRDRFKSTPRDGHPLFTSYIKAALAHKAAGNANALQGEAA